MSEYRSDTCRKALKVLLSRALLSQMFPLLEGWKVSTRALVETFHGSCGGNPSAGTGVSGYRVVESFWYRMLGKFPIEIHVESLTA